MTEEMQFLPRKSVLSGEEILRLATLFVELGVEKIRLTGGETLIRPDIIEMRSRYWFAPASNVGGHLESTFQFLCRCWRWLHPESKSPDQQPKLGRRPITDAGLERG